MDQMKLPPSSIEPELSNPMANPFSIAIQQSSPEIQEISRVDWSHAVMI
jgi:hypothetical protein